jgi:hypothetical protein
MAANYIIVYSPKFRKAFDKMTAEEQRSADIDGFVFGSWCMLGYIG